MPAIADRRDAIASTPTDRQNLKRQYEILARCPHFLTLCRSMPCPLLVLNQELQVVTANPHLVGMLGATSDRQLSGARLGEIFGCINATNGDGCGSTASCRICKALAAVRSARDGETRQADCLIDPCDPVGSDRENLADQFQLSVNAEPLEIEFEEFVLVTFQDVSAYRHRNSLERAFFHDILNTAGGMQGLSQLMLEADPEQAQDLKQSVKELADQLVDEITAQRDLCAAESGEISLEYRDIRSDDLLRLVASHYWHHPAADQRAIALASDHEPATLRTDATLLSRVLGNMVKNALEACNVDEVVTLDCGRGPGGVWFTVHNPGHMSEEVKRGVFKRAFSTKGRGRGQGTYSMLLLGERYLGGRVTFTSDAATGTVFKITLPVGGP